MIDSHGSKRWRGPLRWLLTGLGLILTFLVGTLGGLILHADLPIFRTLAAETASRVLSSTFEGHIVIRSLEQLSAGGLEASRVEIDDPKGTQVLVADGVRVHASLLDIASEAIFGRDHLAVVIQHVRIERATVSLEKDPETGRTTLERAFTPVSGPSTGPTGPKRLISVWLPLIELGQVEVTTRSLWQGKQPLVARVDRARGRVRVQPDSVSVQVERFSAAVSGLVAEQLRGVGSTDLQFPGSKHLDLQGFWGSLEFQGRLRNDDERLKVQLDVPQAEPEAVRALLPGWPLRDPVNAHLSASGSWPVMEATLNVTGADDATLDAEGVVRFDGDPRIDVQVTGAGLDLRSAWPDAPRTRLAIQADLQAQVADGGVSGKFNATSQSTSIAGVEVPRVQATGEFDPAGVWAEGRIFEPDAQTAFRVQAREGEDFTFSARMDSVALQRFRFTPDGVSGSGALQLEGSVGQEQLHFHAQASVRNLRAGDVRAGQVQVKASGSAPLSNLTAVRGSLNGTGSNLGLGELEFDSVKLQAQGPWQRPRINLGLQAEHGRQLSVDGTATLHPQLNLHDASLRLKERDLVLSARVHEFDPSVPSIELQDLELSGRHGHVSGWLRYRPNLLETNLEAEQLDLARLSRSLGMGRRGIRGQVDLDLDLAIGRDVTRGQVALRLTRGSWAGVGDTTARISALLRDKELEVELSGIDPLVGAFGGRTTLGLAGSPLQAASYIDATGTAELQVDGVPLDPVSLILDEDSPVRSLSGQGKARVLIERPRSDSFANILAEITLTQLNLGIRGLPDDRDLVSGGRLQANLSFDNEGRVLSGALSLRDQSSELLAASGTYALDVQQFLTHPQERKQLLSNAAVDVVASVAPRSLQALPLDLSPLTGTLTARGTLHGTVAEPRLTVSLSGQQIVDASSARALAIDVMALADYVPSSNQVSVQASATRQGLRIANLQGQWELPHATEGGSSAPLQGELEAHLHDFPLNVAGPLADGNVSGGVSGALRLKHRPGNVELRAMLNPRGVNIAGSKLGDGVLLLDGSQNQIHGQLQLSDGAASVNTRVLLNFAREQYLQSMALQIDARRLEASLLTPVLTGLVSRLGGQLDVQSQFVADRKSAESDWKAHLDGQVAWSNGGAYIDALGIELREIRGIAGSRSVGDLNVISLGGLRAKVRSAKDNISGDASLTLDGLVLKGGEARILLDDFPFTVEGVPKGWGTGSAQATLTRNPDHMLVDVQVAELMARLPNDTSRDVLDLRDNPDFHVVQFEAVEADAPSLPWRFLIHLGQHTRVTRPDMDLMVSGSPRIDLADETTTSGTLELLPGGRLQALGKAFIVEHGRMTLNPSDSANPLLDLRAAWRAPDGVTIYATVHGPLKDLGEIQLGSDAGLSREDIWNRITGASSGVATNNSDESTMSGAGAAGMGVAALGVGELVGGSLNDVEVRFDPGENASYAAAVRLSDKLWFEGRYQRDETAAMVGGPSNVVSGAFDYRFAPKWSLRTELGNAGGTFDLLWQHRY